MIEEPPAPSSKRAPRQKIPPEIWALAEEDYEVRAMMPRVIGKKYGIRRETVSHHMTAKGKVRGCRAPAPALDILPHERALTAWRATAHPAQLPPPEQWATWLFQGGRGAGKTRAGAEWIAQEIARTPGGSFALVGATMRDVREVMIEGPAGLMHLPHRPRPRWEATRARLVFDNDAVAYAFSSQEPERLRGPQFHGAWADEFCAWHRPSRTLEVLRFGLRRGDDPRLVVTTTPKPIAALRALRAETSCAVTQAPSAANAQHLSPRFLERLTDIYANTTLARQELEGLIVEGESPLWRARDFDAARGNRPASFDRVVVGVDPPAGAGEGRSGSACGIIVVGQRDRSAYVLADRTVLGASPLGWAHAVRDAAAAYGARAVVAEANQGGHMVRTTLASAGVACAIKLVHAREGKRARAEPVAALYEQGRVVHCGAFPALEEEMMALGEAEMEGRFDRADALVWAVTALLVQAGPAGAPPRVLQL
ncbi:MAG: terminase family protein [Hyphomonadaceae bacterium]|nr:terminase family protein [Hyphomonadaceae bacterium]